MVSIVVAAVAAGARAGLTDSVTDAVKSAYARLKGLITGRYAAVDVALVERNPQSGAKRDSLAEDLTEAGAGEDAELLEAARALIAVIREHAPQAGSAIGIDLKRVEAEALRIGSVESTGDGVKVEDGKFHGPIDIQNVKAGFQEPPDPTTARK